jgi:integrase
MFPHAEQALREQREATQGRGPWVFPNTEGGPLHLDNLRNRVWNPRLARAGLRPRTPYQTRHTFASQLLSRGADIDWVARLMGHADTRMVIQRYWKYIRNRAQQDSYNYVAERRHAMEGIAGENRP